MDINPYMQDQSEPNSSRFNTCTESKLENFIVRKLMLSAILAAALSVVFGAWEPPKNSPFHDFYNILEITYNNK